MNRTFALLLVMASLTSVRAQGTFEFIVTLSGVNEVPPNSTGQFGGGTFSLNGGSLTYLVSGLMLFQNFGVPTDVTINGPANAGSLAPVIFDLGTPVNKPIQPPPGALFVVSGTVDNLTGPQISDLNAGLWYVNVITPDFPGGEIRGQITPVPEPSTLVLLGLGAGGLVLWTRKKHRRA